MELAPHQQRVIGEKRELDDRLGKLVAFIDSAIFDGLDAEEQDRLRRQAACMADLSQILGERIAAFGDLSRALDSGLATATVGDLGHE